MAEVFGAVASGAGLVSLALQLGECALKIKHLCDQAKKVPDALRMLEVEINIFSLVLQDIEASRVQRGVTATSVLLQCIYHCQIVTGKIVAYVSELERMSKKFKLPGRIFAALRMTDIAGLCNDMERAKSNLMLASLSFQTSLQGSLLASSLAMSNQIATLSSFSRPPANQDIQTFQAIEESTDESETAITVRKPSTNKSQLQKRNAVENVFRLRLAWFNWTVWNLSMRRSRGYLEFDFRCDNLVPYDSLIFWHAGRGDALAMKKMFSEGTASPYDTWRSWGRLGTLFDCLDWTTPVDIFAVILEAMCTEDRGPAAEPVLKEGDPWSSNKYPVAESLAYLAESQSIDLTEVIPDAAWAGRYSRTLLPILRRNVIDFRCDWSFKRRFELIVCRPSYRLYNISAQVILQYCCSDDGLESLLMLENVDGYNILQSLARDIGKLAGTDEHWQDFGGWAELFTMLLNIVNDSSTLYETFLGPNEVHGTLFSFFCRSFVNNHEVIPIEGRRRELPNRELMSVWTQLLRSGGIEPERFYQDEMKAWNGRKKHMGFHRNLRMECSKVYWDDQNTEWCLDAEYFRVVMTRKLKRILAPGAWPPSPDVPQVVCWSPRADHPEYDEGYWEMMDAIGIRLTERYMEHVLRLEEFLLPQHWRKYINGKSKSVRDDDELDRNPRDTRLPHRRSRSEPPVLLQAYSFRQGAIAGSVIHCCFHTKWNLKYGLGSIETSDYQCQDERCYCIRNRRYSSEHCDFERFIPIAKQWHKFVESHKVEPARCRGDSVDLKPRKNTWKTYSGFRTIDDEVILNIARDPDWWASYACDKFPACEHQQYYLESLRAMGKI